jgi:CubicO group peptidase (beta-lactamase class C family)
MRKWILLFFFVLVLEAPRVAAADPECRSSNKEISDAIREIHDRQSNVGLAAAIVRGGQVVFTEHLGLADVEFAVEVNSETRFGIASITKLYTAVALLQMKADGRLELSDVVQKHFPDFPLKPEGDITLEMLATHTSGIPHPQSVRTPELFATHFDQATETVSVFADVELQFEPGTDVQYSSSNYNLIAAVIEQQSGQNFKEFIAASIFEPLNLTETTFNDVLRPLPFRARRYSFYHPWTYAESDEIFLVPVWDYSFNTGGGNIVATATDIARFGAALSEPGLLPENELNLLLSEEWFGDTDENGRKFLYASGANPGLQAGLAVIPESGIAAAILSNTWGLGSRSGEMTQLALKMAQMCD